MVNRAGLVADTAGGALLLDEIDAMPPAQRGLLLRDELGEYERAGDPRLRISDLRCLAITARPPAELGADARRSQRLTRPNALAEWRNPRQRGRRSDRTPPPVQIAPVE